jgi:outer membrane receptor for ferrienterochelin and colicin
MIKPYFVFFTLLFTFPLFSQQYTISGYVSDAASSEKLIGVRVYSPSTEEGTVTNNYGFYSLTLTKAEGIELVFEYFDYVVQVQKITLTQNTNLNIDLAQSITMEEVVVVAEKQKRIERESQMSIAEIPIGQIKKIPALLGEVDVLKALQLLPGVKSGGEGQSGLYVRGGGPDQNLILLDGVPVYNANHLFGFFSVFNSDAIKDVKLIKGGFPARYGGRLSSVLDINMKEGNMNKIKGSASIGIISSKLMIEGPINKGKTSFIVSGRRTYIDVLTKPFIKSAFANDGVDGSTGYYFYDLNVKVNHKFSDKDRLYLSTYVGKDKFYLELRDKESQDISFTDNSLAWGNITNALRWNHVVNPKMFLNATAIYSDYRLNTYFNFGTEKINGTNDKSQFGLNYISGIEDYGLKLDFDYVPTPNHFVRFGINTIKHQFKPGKFFLLNDDTAINLSFRDTVGQDNIGALESSIFVEDDWDVSKNFKVNGGLHLSAFGVSKKSYFSLQPRISARWLLPKDWALKASFASMRQYINLLSFEGIGLPTDLWVPATDRIKPQDSWQAAIGLAKTISDDYELSIEGYYKKMKNLVAYKDGAGVFQSDNWQDRVVQGNGEAYGAEVFLQKKNGRLTGWIGYTLSWTNRSFPDIDNGQAFPYRYDRRHDFSFVASYEISKKINISGTWVYGTGNAVTLANSRYDNELPSTNQFSNFINSTEVFGNRNNFRLRPYHRLDVGINFVKKKKSWTRTFSVGAYNAYANNNPFYIYFGDKDTIDANGNYTTKRVLKQASLFPLIPYITWTADF